MRKHGETGTIQSVKVTSNIIDELQTRSGAGVTELAQELDRSKSAVHTPLRTLEDRDILVREDDASRLSVSILDMAKYVRDQSDNYASSGTRSGHSRTRRVRSRTSACGNMTR
ncbi:helix-turn-helix domain-containing protein [haloarchaeon 3A1-DGR]|nr:helix-turn-helix domain-containing protein [haloarchaeon 3A1-DGR]